MKTIILLLIAASGLFAQQTYPAGTLQVQSDPSGSCTVGSVLQYNNSNGKLWGCNGTWVEIGSGGGGSMTWPGTPGITVCTGTPCTAWGTSLAAPTGVIVGTTDTQTLIGKTVDGVTPTVFGFLDFSSSGQTQLNAKVPTARTVNGHALSGDVVVSASDLTTGTLPHAQLPALVSGDIPNNAANTSGTAANVSGTPALPNGTTATTQSQADGSTKLATTAYADTLGATKAASNAATTVNGQTCTLGLTCTIPLSAINAQTATYQVLAGDFSNYKTITAASGTFTVTLVASGSQPANGQYISVVNYGSGVVTIARSGQNINGGTASLTLAAGSATAPTSAMIWSDGTNYFATTSSAGAAGITFTQRGMTSGKPACNAGNNGLLYFATDSVLSYQCNGSTYQAYDGTVPVTPPGAIGGYTTVGTGASLTIANDGDTIILTNSGFSGLAGFYSSATYVAGSSIITAEFTASSANDIACGPAIYQDSSNAVIFGTYGNGGLDLFHVIGGSAAQGTLGPTAVGFSNSPGAWFRFRSASSTSLVGEISNDGGVTWVNLSVATFNINISSFSTFHMGFFCRSGNTTAPASMLIKHLTFQ